MESPKIITNIKKSKSDKFDCQIKILQNGLKALLVSDPEAENSSAALGVNVGSFIDNPDEMGLAHFCEHLLFMGTEKYPSENEYEEYLSKNGGFSNAFTGGDKTVYYFNVVNDAFEGAVDRFAQFFISPKFNEDSVEREINAIDSEFSKNKNNDIRRFNHLFKSELTEGCSFNKFSTGNKEVLNQTDLRDRLLKMYYKYYSSEIMNLVLYSKLSMEDLNKLLDNLFTSVPKRENFEMPKYDKVKPYNENTVGFFYKIIPIKNVDKIRFIWYLPFCENYYARPLKFWSSLFGHEGPNTITASLKRDNLITSLTTSTKDYANTFSTFELEVELTKKGFDNYKEVILRILNYFQVIQSKKICERYFNEEKNISQLNFDFRNKKKPIDFTKAYASNLMLYKPEDVFTGDYLYQEYNEELIKKYLDLLNMGNLNIYFFSQSFEKECNLIEKIYGTKYTKEKMKISKEEVDSYKCGHIFDYPPENKFCPEKFDIFPPEENLQKYPEKILDEQNCKVWFLQDNIFKLPKGRIKAQFNFVKNLCYNSDIKNRAVSALLKKIIKLEINEIIYMASEAKVNFKIKLYYNKLEISIEGFNDSLKKGLKEILTMIQNININTEKHKDILDLLKKEHIKKKKNFFYDISYKVNLDYINRLLSYPSIDLRDYIDYLSTSKITIDDLISFKNNMLLEVESNWLIQGNLLKKEALEIVQMTNNILKINTNTKISKPFYENRIVELRSNINYIFRLLNPNREEKDSSIISIYQFGLLLEEEKQYFSLLYLFLSDKFYDTLRTKETLGYIASLTTRIFNEIRHFAGVIQSNKKDPEYCSERIRNFFMEKMKDVKEISDENFNTLVKSRLEAETKKDRDLEEQFNRNWTEIVLKRFEFDIKEKNVELLKKCNKEGFIRFFEKHFVNEVKKLDVEYVCQSHNEENEKKIFQKYDDNINIKKRIVVDKISDFHACNSLYPSCSNSFYRELNI